MPLDLPQPTQHDGRLVLTVPLAERAYDIQIGTGNLDHIAEFLQARLAISHAVVVTDHNVEGTHGRRAAEALGRACRADLVAVEAGEASKSVATANWLWQRLLALGADRKTVVVAVGGGVVGDLAGFVAATFARGLAYVQVPTTLLAQVDSSVGGKVAVNLPAAKNMVGCFWQPRGVVIDTAVLLTLSDREYRAGLAEVVKYGVILDAEFFAWLEGHVDDLRQRRDDALRHVVLRCCQLKAHVVARDEREETGLRSVLNYGHTYCHALEAVTGYRQLLHGEGVAIGMLCASRLAERLGRVDAAFTRRQRDLLAALGLPVDVPQVDRRQVALATAHDKKVEHGKLRFVLPARMGEVELVGDVREEDALAALGEV
ncbi:MAG: 3-dehydroquinate synthase [Planctomycetia bacterium]|nr:3-dehydroquinate synthase [Planctomycetia bacterium]